jgi:spore maturation protein SpmB
VPGREGGIDDHDIDLIMAALRADTADLSMFLDVIAVKLADALPDHTQVERTAWPRRRVRAVTVDLGTVGNRRFRLQRGHGIQADIAHVVKGVTLSTQRVQVDEWLRALATSLAEFGAAQARGREALDRLLH